MIDTIRNGFSLIELMLVVAIIGVLSLLALPSYQDYILRTKIVKAINETSPLQIRILDAYINGGRDGLYQTYSEMWNNQYEFASDVVAYVTPYGGNTSLLVYTIHLKSEEIGLDKAIGIPSFMGSGIREIGVKYSVEGELIFNNGEYVWKDPDNKGKRVEIITGPFCGQPHSNFLTHTGFDIPRRYLPLGCRHANTIGSVILEGATDF